MSIDISAVAGAVGSHAMSGASWSAPPQQKMASLFDKIDTSGSGTISAAQFQSAFQTQNPPAVFQQQGPNAIWSQLDPNATGSVSKDTFVQVMAGLMASLRADPPAVASANGAATAAAGTAALQAPGGGVNILA